ncbi:MAG TPA: hypothetical protein VK978_00840 [Candidatus Saccharimonadales bacterium]|nr:hypothetical protein [Candidatus Saccharimonadales bacterium]
MERTERIKSLLTTKWAYIAYGLLLGTFLVLAIRFITYAAPHDTHYHANFGVYINGEQEKFKAPQYYEEVSICGLHDAMQPKMRAHMHNQEAGAIHVHDDGVTWGQLFNNLGWYVGPDFIRTNDRMYVADDLNKLNIVLNGDNLTGLSTITNELIDDQDRLLISYGDADVGTLESQFKSVPNNAAEYNSKPDPATCSGGHETTIGDRFKNLL